MLEEIDREMEKRRKRVEDHGRGRRNRFGSWRTLGEEEGCKRSEWGLRS